MVRDEISKNIRKFRKRLGVTQTVMANIVGTNIRTYSGWERRVSTPTIEGLIKLANCLGVTVDDLVGADSWKTLKNEKPADTVKSVIVYAKIGDDYINSQAKHTFGNFYINGTDITKFVSHWRYPYENPTNK